MYSLAVCVFYVTSCTISFLCFTDNKASGISSAKRKILDSSPTSGFQPCSSPSKRFKAEASTHSVSSTGVASLPSSSKHVSGAAACSTVTYTISPIRINNSSKPIVNITPSSSVKGRIMSDQSLLWAAWFRHLCKVSGGIYLSDDWILVFSAMWLNCIVFRWACKYIAFVTQGSVRVSFTSNSWVITMNSFNLDFSIHHLISGTLPLFSVVFTFTPILSTQLDLVNNYLLS